MRGVSSDTVSSGVSGKSTSPGTGSRGGQPPPKYTPSLRRYPPPGSPPRPRPGVLSPQSCFGRSSLRVPLGVSLWGREAPRIARSTGPPKRTGSRPSANGAVTGPSAQTDPGVEPGSPALQVDSLPLSHQGNLQKRNDPWFSIPSLVLMQSLLLLTFLCLQKSTNFHCIQIHLQWKQSR